MSSPITSFAGRLMAKDVVGQEVRSTTVSEGSKLEGARLGRTASRSPSATRGSSRPTSTASNGVIHVIDTVLMPKPGKKGAKKTYGDTKRTQAPSIVGIAKQAGQFNTLLAAAKAAGLVGRAEQR